MMFITASLQGMPDLSGRAIRRVSKESYGDVGEVLHTTILPRHWQVDAAQKYRHQPRTPGTIRRKQRLAERTAWFKTVDGQPIDNLHTGKMRSQMLAVGVVRAFPSRVSLRLQAPRYMTMRPYKSGQPDKFAEIQRATPDDVQLMEVTWRDGAEKRIQVEIDKKR